VPLAPNDVRIQLEGDRHSNAFDRVCAGRERADRARPEHDAGTISKLRAALVAWTLALEPGHEQADSLVLGPKGAKVRGKAITTAHEAEVPVPSSEAGRLLYEAVMR
jgi:hypothetical protein